MAHGLWAGAASEALRRRSGRPRAVVAWAVLLGLLPDLLQLVPVLAWSVTQPEPLHTLLAYAIATTARELAMPPLVNAASHHLHCAMHSVIVAGAVTAVIAWKWRAALLPLTGWWLHIALDIPSHSQSYYAVPFLYPITYWGFDGIAWTTPWMIVLNYAAIAVAYMALWLGRGRTAS